MFLQQKLGNKKAFTILSLISLLLLITIFIVGKGYPTFDQKFFYLKSEIRPLLDNLGEPGRACYHLVNMTDFAFIIAYGLWFASAYFLFFKEQAQTLLIVPAMTVLFDLIETSIVAVLLKNYPTPYPQLETLMMIATPVKWFFAIASILIVANGYLIKKYLGPNSQS
jgi:hypothetical protein